TRPTTATSSWGSAWRGRSLEAGACVLTLFFFLDEFQERLSFSASAGFRFKQIEERRFNETNMAHLAVGGTCPFRDRPGAGHKQRRRRGRDSGATVAAAPGPPCG